MRKSADSSPISADYLGMISELREELVLLAEALAEEGLDEDGEVAKICVDMEGFLERCYDNFPDPENCDGETNRFATSSRYLIKAQVISNRLSVCAEERGVGGSDECGDLARLSGELDAIVCDWREAIETLPGI